MFALLTVAHTWPIAASPSHWSRVEGDGALNVWAIGWVGHSLTRAPSHLFDANIFYPEKLTLAYSEAMVVQGAIGAPVIAAGGSAVLAYNLALLAGFALTGWAFCLLVWRWTASWAAGYVAGSLAAFNAHTLSQLTHLQFQHAEFFALMLYALDQLLTTRHLKPVLTLGIGFALQGLTSIYLLVFSIWMLLFAALARIRELLAGGGRLVGRLAVAGIVAAALLAPYLMEYAAVRNQMGFGRMADEEEAASWANYLSTGSRLYFDRFSREFTATATSFTFPGIAAIALIIVAWSDRRNTADRRYRMAAVAALGCMAVSFAPLLPFYQQVHAAVPLFQAVRVLPHIGQVVLLMIAVLAGFGVATLQRVWTHPRSWPIALAVILIAVNGEALRAPLGVTWFEGVPAVYDVLANEPGAVVAEAPFPIPQQWFLNAQYMVNSTRHWKPLLNGYSGFRPASYERSYQAMRGFPSDDSLLRLHALGVTHVVVHQRAMNHGEPDDRYDPYENVPSLRLLKRDEDVLIYELLRR